MGATEAMKMGSSKFWWKMGGVLLVLISCSLASEDDCPQAIFAFGASVTDTGNVEAAYPYTFAPQTSLPYGETFFHKPANRYSNGRLIVDFYAQALKFPLLSPYLQPVGSDYRHGVNFALAGATAQNTTLPAPTKAPFYFWIQAKQFQYFKEKTLALWSSPRGTLQGRFTKLLTKPRYFDKGLFFITIGDNDFFLPLLNGVQSIEQVRNNISVISKAIVAGVEELYRQGAKTLVVFNVPPLGCYPAILTVLGASNMSTYDADGCLATLNAVIETSNSLLKAGLDNLRTKASDATIIYADFYGVVNSFIRNSSQYGFTETTMACCGAGVGKYNFSPYALCGSSAVVNGVLLEGKSCPDPSNHVNWDGVHITEAAAQLVAEKFLAGQYLEPSYALTELCNLDFKQF